MTKRQKAKYTVGRRPPTTLTDKAREQLESAQPSVHVAALANNFAKLFSISSTGQKVLIIPGLDPLKPGNLDDLLTAETAAVAARKSSGKERSRKSISRVK
jgi:hypothetical protein